MKQLLRFPYLLLLSSILLLSNGCNNDLATPAASWMYIPRFDLINPFEPSDTTTKVGFVQVYVDSLLIGAYNLPALVPVLRDGAADIVLVAGIEDNGISATQALYPFYNSYHTIADLTYGDSTTVIPTLSYNMNETQFGLHESFESSNSYLIDEDGNTQTGVGVSTDPAEVAYGLRCGVVNLGQSDSTRVFEGTCQFRAPLPQNGTPVYIEMDYNTDVVLQVSLRMYVNDQATDNQPIIYLTPTEGDWNKIYINATDLLQALEAETFSISFKAILPADQEAGRILLDNIKLLHVKQ
jgi:hypothetical protein